MIKRTILLTTVFATLLSAAFSVQAANYDYYWKGGAGNYFVQTNWQLSDGSDAPVALDSSGNVITAYVVADDSSVSVNYSVLGPAVRSLTIGGGTGSASVTRSSYTFTIDSDKFISVLNNGSFTVGNTLFINANGTMTVNGGSLTTNGVDVSGTFDYTSANNFVNANTININAGGSFKVAGSGQFRMSGASAIMNIQGGSATVDSISYIGVTANGVINQSGGNATFSNALVFGWGAGNGTYNLSNGTLTTESFAGLWCAKSSGFNTFNVTGGTANFGKTGNSFEVGLYNDGTNYTWTPQSVANVFNLNSGTVNAADTFAVQYGGTLNVAKTAENTLGDGVLNAKAITLTHTGNLNMSSGTINVGEGGIKSSDGAYTITLSGGTFGTNGASWSSALNAAISDNTVTFAPADGKTITWSGNFTKENNSDRGTIRKTGAGTLAFNSTSDTSANTIDANLTIDEGTVILNQSPGGDNRFADGVVVKVNAGGKLQCNAHDSIGYGSSAVTFELNGGELAIQSSPNETLINKTVKLKGGTVSTLSNNMMDICANGNAFIVEAETGATAQNPTTSYIKGWLRLRNTTDFEITVNENAKLVVDKNFGIYDNSESTKPLVKRGSGVLVFEGNNSYTQGTKISAGTLILTENGSLGTGAVVNEASLVFAHDSEQTFTNAVSGNGTVTKTGAGRLKINAANGFQASELIVSNGRLDFLGTMTGGITVNPNTVFSPGNSVGTADVNGLFSLGSGATLLLEQDSAGMDLLKATFFDVASGTIDLEMGSVQPGKTYAIIQNTSEVFGPDRGVDFWTSLLTASDANYWKLSVDGDTVYATIDANAVPEPSTWLLLLFGTFGLLYWRKK
ncbi:MAG: autotransporter-associated beta strand repeat-containing protein [Thermoguttaceae bacterium]|nr:autotransporter-associated beta strand repeat-containing protein [Thermoguttaceae bacterium]